MTDSTDQLIVFRNSVKIFSVVHVGAYKFIKARIRIYESCRRTIFEAVRNRQRNRNIIIHVIRVIGFGQLATIQF